MRGLCDVSGSRAGRLLAIVLLTAWPAIAAAQPRHAPHFELTYEEAVSEQPFTGDVFVMLSQHSSGAPMAIPREFVPEPMFAQRVQNWRPGTPLELDPAKCRYYPVRMDELPAGTYRAQAVMVLNDWSHEVVLAPGNGYSDTESFEHDPGQPPTVRLKIESKLPLPKLRERADRKYVRVRSKLLSDFCGRDVYMQAAVKLPRAYLIDETRKFPTLYMIPGFGASLAQAMYLLRDDRFEKAGADIVLVYLDPDCPTGHHVFADSANNGPWGAALTTELIPQFERDFRLIPRAEARFVTGHSSGGWSSLWLQVTYPEVFGGVWSTSPDPVDFTAFQWIDVYDPEDNLFVDKEGHERVVGRGEPFGRLPIRRMMEVERTVGRGGQLYSFLAVFSPRGADGQPLSPWDLETGRRVHADVAEAWRKYDIRQTIETNWETLGPKLAGKLHLFCGDQDTFFLERAFLRLRETLQRLGSDAYIEVIPGANHGLPDGVDQTIARQVAEQCRKVGEAP